MSESYKDYQARIAEEQEGMTKDEIAAEMEARHEYVQDLDNLPEVKHNWVERGLKVSCEGANHPHHSHFLVKR